jgi:DNA-binding MarR family transcriptional regulator
MDVADFKSIIWDYTRKIAESMNCIFSPVSGNYGLTMMQTRILMELHQYDNHTIGSLADRICVAGANISAMCKKLEGQGLVERIRDKSDERVVKVVLTKQGKETVTEIDRLCNEKISLYLINEKEETFEDIIAGLKKLNELLKRMSCIDKK